MQILEQACDWFIDFNEDELDAGGCERFNRWLRRSPEHVQAYLEIAATWQDASILGDSRGSEVAALVEQALAESNVVRLYPGAGESHTAETAAGPSTFSRLTSGRLPWLLVAAACALAAVGLTLLHRGNIYATGTGEFRSVMLDDGSTIELDTRSQVKVRFSRNERMVEVIGGQALFSVKTDAVRPFVVRSNEARVRAVGTQFDVYRKPVETTVTTVEGKVTVTDTGLPTQAAGAEAILLSAGQQVTLTPGTIPHAVPADLEAATAWTRRKLIFMETPLSQVVEELNRYNTRQIIIEDPSLSEYHIRGRFEASDPGQLLRFLRERFNANVREHGNEIRVSRNK